MLWCITVNHWSFANKTVAALTLPTPSEATTSRFPVKRCSFLPDHHIDWFVLAENVILSGNSLNSQIFLPQKRAGLFFREFRCSGAGDNSITGALPGIFSYSTEQLDLPGKCKYVPVSLFKIKRNGIILPGSKRILQRTTSGKSLLEYLILQG